MDRREQIARVNCPEWAFAGPGDPDYREYFIPRDVNGEFLDPIPAWIKLSISAMRMITHAYDIADFQLAEERTAELQRIIDEPFGLYKLTIEDVYDALTFNIVNKNQFADWVDNREDIAYDRGRDYEIQSQTDLR